MVIEALEIQRTPSIEKRSWGKIYMVLPDIVVQLRGWACSKDMASANWVFFVHQKKQVGGGYPTEIMRQRKKERKFCEIIDLTVSVTMQNAT